MGLLDWLLEPGKVKTKLCTYKGHVIVGAEAIVKTINKVKDEESKEPNELVWCTDRNLGCRRGTLDNRTEVITRAEGFNDLSVDEAKSLEEILDSGSFSKLELIHIRRDENAAFCHAFYLDLNRSKGSKSLGIFVPYVDVTNASGTIRGYGYPFVTADLDGLKQFYGNAIMKDKRNALASKYAKSCDTAMRGIRYLGISCSQFQASLDRWLVAGLVTHYQNFIYPSYAAFSILAGVGILQTVIYLRSQMRIMDIKACDYESELAKIDKQIEAADAVKYVKGKEALRMLHNTYGHLLNPSNSPQ